MRTLARFAAGIALKGVLEKVTGRSEPASRAAARPARPARASRRRPQRRPVTHTARRAGSVAPAPARRGVAFVLMMAGAAVSLPLMLIFESTPTRIAGVAAMVVFIVAGVFAIADPAFLDTDEEERA